MQTKNKVKMLKSLTEDQTFSYRHSEEIEWEGILQSSLTLWPLPYHWREVKRLPQFVSEETDRRQQRLG